jgi:hypothetical protein
MLLDDKPEKIAEIAKECGNDFKPVNMHLIGLAKSGHITSLGKGMYVIAQKGKEALGIAETSKESAKEILAETSSDKAFHFYADMEKPLNLDANGLKDFAEKTEIVELASLEFHLQRGDFEKWFTSLGDAELAKKMALLKASGMLGEPLRAKLNEIAINRYVALFRLSQEQFPQVTVALPV